MIPSLRAPARAFAALVLFGLSATWVSAAAAQQLSITDASIAEGNSGTKSLSFTIKLSAPSSTVTKVDVATANGSALAGSDYVATSNLGLRMAAGVTSKSFLVPINGDTAVEPDETFTVNLSNPVGATISDAQGVGTITNDDGPPTLTVADASMNEGNSGTKTMTFTVSLSGTSPDPVQYRIFTDNLTALAGSDYVSQDLGAQVIPAGQTSKTFSVTINGDTTVEPDEQFLVQVTDLTGAVAGDAQARGTIVNDDTGPAPSLSIADVSVQEGNDSYQDVYFTVSLSAATSSDVTYDITPTDGSAVQTMDYVATGAVGETIPAGQTSRQFHVMVFGDNNVEGDETFTVNVSNVVGATVADGQAIGTILNDDTAPVPTLSVDNAEVTEGNSGTKTVTFTVSLSNPYSQQVQFNLWTVDGTATLANNDYVQGSYSLQVMQPGETAKTFTFQVNGDTNWEPDEAFHVILESQTMAVQVSDATGDATILNDDDCSSPQLTLEDARVVEGNAGTSTLLFTAKLNTYPSQPVTFDFATSDGTATAGSDYAATSLVGTLQIRPSQTSIVIPVTVTGDNIAEANETLNATLSNVSGASVCRASAKGLIWNDDSNIIVSSPQDPSLQAAGSTGVVGNTYAVSADGRYVAFTSNGNDLIPGQTVDTWSDIFLRDLRTGETTLVTKSYTGNGALGSSAYPSISADGRYVVYESWSDGLAVNDNNGLTDVYRWDRNTGQSELVSVTTGGTTNANYQSNAASISANGRFVVFQSSAPDLVASDPNGTKQDVFIRDMQTHTTTMVSIATAGPSAPLSGSQGPRVSPDGRYVTFASDDPNIVAGDTDGLMNAFIRDRTAGTTTKVAFDAGYQTFGAVLSANARYLLFSAQNADFQSHLWVRDLQTNALEQVDVRFDGQVILQGYSGSYANSISDDGRYVAFWTYYNGMVASDDNGQADAFVRDLALDSTWMAQGGRNMPVITGDGKYLVYSTNDNTMVVGDNNWKEDVFRVAVPQATMPTLSVADVSVPEGNADKQVQVTVSLSAPASAPVSFDIETVDGTAYAWDGDYDTAKTFGVTIAAGQSSASFTVNVHGDTAKESDETVEIYVSNVHGAMVADDHGQLTLVNDDFSDLPALSIGPDVSMAEGNSGTKLMSFTISLSAPSPTDVNYTIYTMDQTTSGDFVPFSDSFVMPAGTTSQVRSITINGDLVPEADETFSVNLHANTANVVEGDVQAIGTILDDDYANAPSISIADASAAEGNSNHDLPFTISLSKASASPVCFGAQVSSGSATMWEDFDGGGLQACIPAGVTSTTFNAQVYGDFKVEPDESFNVTLVNVDGATVLDGAAVGTILNDDAAPTLSIGDVSISEGNSGTKTATFTVTSSIPAQGDGFSFNVATANGTATAGSDYVALPTTVKFIPTGQTSTTVAVTINGDTTVEADETFSVVLSNPVGATIADGTAVGTIVNDDSGGGGPTLSINDVSVTEGNSATKTATFTITLSAAQSGPVLVDVATANGTATAGTDYVAKTQSGLRIPAGTTSKTFAVTINGDTTSEPDETYTVDLSNASAGIAIADGQGLGTISNDDAAATPTLSIADASVTEGNSGTKTLTFTVSLSPAASGTVSYDIATSNGTATAGSDYVASTLTGQTISAGATSKTFVVTINGDTTTEANETFNVTLSNVSGATLGDGQAVGTITNDDGASGPTLSIGDVSLAEGNSLSKQMTFTVTLSAPASTAVTYAIATADGTAIAPTDYTSKSLTGQSIAAGATSKTFTVAVKGDKTVESNETFLVNVTSVVGATVADGQATGTITNDDAAALSVARFDARGLVDDVDDGNRQPQIAPREYATLLADSANALCRRAPGATVIAVEGVEHRRVLSDLADAANAICASKPQYTAVMADSDSRGFLIATPAKDEVGTSVLGKPEVNVNAKSTTLSILAAGHATPVTLVLAAPQGKLPSERTAQAKALAQELQLRSKAQPDEAIVLLGANAASGMVDLTNRELGKSRLPLPAERVLVNRALLKIYGKPAIELAPPSATEPPAQLLRLQQ